MPTYKAVFSTCRLVRERTVTYQADSACVRSPAVAAQIVRSLTRRSPTEWLVALYLNAENKLCGCSIVARGGRSGCAVTPADVFRPAVACAAVGLIIAHNHPSGCCEPSEADRHFSRCVRHAGEALGIVLLDSLVVTDATEYSCADKEWG